VHQSKGDEAGGDGEPEAESERLEDTGEAVVEGRLVEAVLEREVDLLVWRVCEDGKHGKYGKYTLG
jgi:hypothetical protein